jgi:putative YhdH/YhfP family quinone oxidoreductase
MIARMSDSFPAFTAEKTDDGFRRGVTELTIDDLPSGDVVIDVEWSSVNYKDHLAATEKGRVARISPLVPGIDLAGTVRSSDAADVSPGDRVLVHGYDLGVAHHGGYAGVARVPAEWVVPLPDGLTAREAMVVGTAGYTAALSVLTLLDHGLESGAGTVLVTGATGGVGSMAVAMLARLGCTVAASTGKADAAAFLRELGATEVVDRAELADAGKPLQSVRWAGAVDAVGGATLANVLATLAPGGAVAASGNVGGAELPTTVLPFILRGVALFGIDSVSTPIDRRRAVWARIATDLKPAGLDAMAQVVDLEHLEGALDEIGRGGVTGRYVVEL